MFLVGLRFLGFTQSRNKEQPREHDWMDWMHHYCNAEILINFLLHMRIHYTIFAIDFIRLFTMPANERLHKHESFGVQDLL